jgi:hypothetical protein
MEATLKQDTLNIIKNFKEKVNGDFNADEQDIKNIQKLIKTYPSGRSNEYGDDTLYSCIDYAGLKRHQVKDFKFSLEDYKRWQSETIEELKSRRNKLWL